MRITAIDGFNARCTAKGVEREASLFMLQGDQIEPGDYVIVHLGYAVQKISKDEAWRTWQLLEQILDSTSPGDWR